MHRIVPTSFFDSGGSNRAIVRIVAVGWALESSTEEPVNLRTSTFDLDASAAPTLKRQ
jgi:hypothetical protein